MKCETRFIAIFWFIFPKTWTRPHIIGDFCVCCIYCGKERKGVMFSTSNSFYVKVFLLFICFCCEFTQNQEAINDVFGVFTSINSQIQKELLMFCFQFIICQCIHISRFFFVASLFKIKKTTNVFCVFLFVIQLNFKKLHICNGKLLIFMCLPLFFGSLQNWNAKYVHACL